MADRRNKSHKETGKMRALIFAIMSIAWSLFVTFPMYMAILYGVLSTIEAPTYVWVLYVLYGPALFIGIILAIVARIFVGE